MRHLRRAQRTVEKDLRNVAVPAIVAALAVALVLGFFPQAARSSAGYHDAVVADNPVGYWRLSESSGTTIVDELGAGHSGSYTGSVTLGQTGPITTDGSDTAAYFNGGWGSIPYYSDLNPSGNKLSLEFWWKGAAPSGAQFAVLKGYTSHSDPYYQYGVGAGPSGTVRVVVDTSGSFNPWDTGVTWPGDGNWHQIVVTYDGSLASDDLKLYIDGAQQAQTNRTGNVRGYSSALGLMDILNLGSGYQTTGRLDEVSIYNSVLSSSRVSAHYNAATVALPANTVAPALSGTALEGQALAVDNGSWSGSPTSYAYQWRRCDSVGANCSDISGATSSSYTLVAADVGSKIRGAVTATNASGSATATSAATAVVLSAGANASYKQATLADNPVGYWRLSESSGTTITDELGAGHSGSYTGTVTLGQTSPITTDSSDTAAYFNGGWGSIPYYSDLNPTGDKLSIEFWWKGAAPSGAQFAVLKGYTSHSDPYYQYGVGAGPSGTVRVVVDTSGTFSPWDTGVSWPGDGNWHQIVVTYDGSLASNNLKLYIDGAQSAQTNKTGNVRGYSSALGLMDILSLGAGYNATGRLDEVAIYNSALSSTRVGAHFDAATVAPPIPGNVSAPGISGSVAVAETLSTSTGSWTGSPTSFTYQWRRCDAAGQSCSDIAGATSSSYAVTADDIGATLRARVTATNISGSGVASSAATAAVPPTAPPSNVALPTISGTSTVGWTLTASNGSWTQAPTSFTLQWLRCQYDGSSCVEIGGATATTYALTGEDVDTTIRVAVTATNSVGSATDESVPTSAVSALVQVGPPIPPDPQPSLSYNGAHIGGIRWAPVGDGTYKLEYERAGGYWNSAIYECITFIDWPWNTCGNDSQSYDGMGGAYSYQKEIWDEFGPSSSAEGELRQSTVHCGDTGVGAPADNPCYSRIWAPVTTVTASGELVDADGEVVAGTGIHDVTVEAADPRPGAGIPNTGVARLAITRDGGTEVAYSSPDCTAGCPGSYATDLSVDAADLSEGRHSFVAKAVDPTNSASSSDEWQVTVDRTAPTLPTDLRLVAVDGPRATVEWTPSDDPDLADGAAGAGIGHYEIKTQVDDGDWSDWQTAANREITVSPVSTGDTVQVEVRAVDSVGNTSDSSSATFTVPTMTSAGTPTPAPTIDFSTAGGAQVLTDSQLAVTPTAYGATISATINSSNATSFESAVTLAPGEVLEKLPNGTAAIVAAADLGDPVDAAAEMADPGPPLSTSDVPADPGPEPPASQDPVWHPDATQLPADSESLGALPTISEPDAESGSATAPDAADRSLLDEAQSFVTDGLVVGVVGIPRTTDAAGATIPARLAVNNGTITSTVGTVDGASFPLTAEEHVVFESDYGSALATENFASGTHPALEGFSNPAACPSRSRIVLYGSSGFVTLLHQLAGFPSSAYFNAGPPSCTTFYVAVGHNPPPRDNEPPTPDTDPNLWRRTQLDQVHTLICVTCHGRSTEFVAAATIDYGVILREFPSLTPAQAYRVGQSERGLMNQTGQLSIQDHDTWFFNDIPGRHQGGASFLTDKLTRQRVRSLIHGLYNGPTSAQRAVPGIAAIGYVFQGDSFNSSSSYLRAWKRLILNGDFWKSLQSGSGTPYLTMLAQETYVRCHFVCGYQDFDSEVHRTNRFLEHPARLAYAAQTAAATRARRFLDATYAPEVLAWWNTVPGGVEGVQRTARLTKGQMMSLVSMEIYATRRWAKMSNAPFPDGRLFLNWNEGTTPESNATNPDAKGFTKITRADRFRMALRVGLALKGAYSVGDYSAKWVCDAQHGQDARDCIVPKTKYQHDSHLPTWSTFGDPWHP